MSVPNILYLYEPLLRLNSLSTQTTHYSPSKASMCILECGNEGKLLSEKKKKPQGSLLSGTVSLRTFFPRSCDPSTEGPSSQHCFTHTREDFDML